MIGTQPVRAVRMQQAAERLWCRRDRLIDQRERYGRANGSDARYLAALGEIDRLADRAERLEQRRAYVLGVISGPDPISTPMGDILLDCSCNGTEAVACPACMYRAEQQTDDQAFAELEQLWQMQQEPQ